MSLREIPQARHAERRPAPEPAKPVRATFRSDIEGACAAADLVILVQYHDEYDADHLAGISKRFFDTRGVTTATEAHRL